MLLLLLRLICTFNEGLLNAPKGILKDLYLEEPFSTDWPLPLILSFLSFEDRARKGRTRVSGRDERQEKAGAWKGENSPRQSGTGTLGVCRLASQCLHRSFIFTVGGSQSFSPTAAHPQAEKLYRTLQESSNTV